ncbi:MAG: pseudouridine synthase [Cytophagaceae bacterium SCN 52-12]|nr:MAG: pseudouridine synthase [Cytophagaceae bacterium SCN 52-12]
MASGFKYYLVFKPYGMLSQFSREGNAPTLADLGFNFEKDIYPVGRLDADSEGLLLLTNDNRLKTSLLDPKNKHWRTYHVQVEGDITEEACIALSGGVDIVIDGKVYHTKRARATPIDPPSHPERIPPIRVRKSIPDSWLSLSLTEGKNRQVRRMTAAVGFPTLRLVRVAIGSLRMDHLKPGDVVELGTAEVGRIRNR